jgi:hypothetical protein
MQLRFQGPPTNLMHNQSYIKIVIQINVKDCGVMHWGLPCSDSRSASSACASSI